MWAEYPPRSSRSEEMNMKTTRGLSIGMVALVIAVLPAAAQTRRAAQQSTDPAIRIGATDLGGVVTSVKGAEAGVWVVAETTDLPTRFARIVVTDDQGRYVMPDLPKAGYSVWVRGYGLVDSPKIRTAPGKILNLKAVMAPSPAAAAEYYPAIDWHSMLKVPAAAGLGDRKSTRLNSSHDQISYAVFCLKKKKKTYNMV